MCKQIHFIFQKLLFCLLLLLLSFNQHHHSKQALAFRENLWFFFLRIQLLHVNIFFIWLVMFMAFISLLSMKKLFIWPRFFVIDFLSWIKLSVWLIFCLSLKVSFQQESFIFQTKSRKIGLWVRENIIKTHQVTYWGLSMTSWNGRKLYLSMLHEMLLLFFS